MFARMIRFSATTWALSLVGQRHVSFRGPQTRGSYLSLRAILRERVQLIELCLNVGRNFEVHAFSASHRREAYRHGLDAIDEVRAKCPDRSVQLQIFESLQQLLEHHPDLEPREVIEVSLDCVAEIPGTTTGPASRAYLYYTPELVRWAAPIAVEIDPVR